MTHRYPLEPLADRLGIELHATGITLPDDEPAGLTALGAAIGVTEPRWLRHLLRLGLTERHHGGRRVTDSASTEAEAPTWQQLLACRHSAASIAAAPGPRVPLWDQVDETNRLAGVVSRREECTMTDSASIERAKRVVPPMVRQSRDDLFASVRMRLRGLQAQLDVMKWLRENDPTVDRWWHDR